MRKKISARRVSRHQYQNVNTETLSVVLRSMGVQGDAIADIHGKPVHVPGGLPGESVTLRLEKQIDKTSLTAHILSVDTPSADRVTPACPHFGQCGGCQTQHLSPEAELHWKEDKARKAMAQRGLPTDRLMPPVALPPGTRRRAIFSWDRRGAVVVLGFNARRSHALVDIGPCPVLHPDIENTLPILKQMLDCLTLPSRTSGKLQACLADNGLDLCLGLPASPSLEQREILVAFADRLDCARFVLRIGGYIEPLVIHRSPLLLYPGGGEVSLPPGVFLQPCREGEEALQSLVLSALDDIDGTIADLFCGTGTFSLPLVRERRKVCSWDCDSPAVTALSRTGRVEAKVRDLFRNPLEKEELSRFSAVVINPPRAGAQNQCALLARHGPPRLVMVSCNPATFARDARLLVDGGYDLLRIVPVDQFRWSAHLEVVATFARP